MFSVAGAPVVRSCPLVQLSVMLKMPWLGKLVVGLGVRLTDRFRFGSSVYDTNLLL